MEFESRLSLARRQFFCGCCAGAVIGFIPTIAQAADEIVPISREPRHHERFKNEYIRVMEVVIDPGDTTLFHAHQLDLGFVVIRGGEVKNEVPNNPEAQITRIESNTVRFAEYQAKPYVHRLTNRNPDPYWLIAFEIFIPEPGKFDRSSRTDAPVYTSELENSRIHIWRLKLDPGQTAPSISEAGPGLRVFLSGDQVTESMDGTPAQDIHVKKGNFSWQASGTRPAIKNSGPEPIELVEFELR